MKGVKLIAFALLICLTLFYFSCSTPKLKDVRSKFYSMAYEVASESVSEIVESSVNSGDKILLINQGDLYNDYPNRFYSTKEESEEKEYINDKAFLSDPGFMTYIENGFNNRFLKNNGLVIDRLQYPANIGEKYLKKLIEGRLIFNVSPLDYDNWTKLKEDFNVNKVLFYSVSDMIYDKKKQNYLGVKYFFKFLDLDQNGKILWSGTKNAFSSNFPGSFKSIFNESALKIEEGLARFIEKADNALISPIDVVLIKIDEIPTVSYYPVTREDFEIENQIIKSFFSVDKIKILEKISKRTYKIYSQFNNAVFNISPVQGGDYKEFEKYFYTRYYMGYKLLWKNQTKADTTLDKELIGIYFKIVDTKDNGKIILSDLVELGSQKDLQESFLYNCFKQTEDASSNLGYLSSSGVMSDSDKFVLINKRIEAIKDYISNNYPDLLSYMITDKKESENMNVLYYYNDSYKYFSNPDEKNKSSDKNKEFIEYDLTKYLNNALIANSWYEEGLVSAMLNSGLQPHEKLESLYSRYLIKKKTTPDNFYLTPLLLKQWNEIKLHGYEKVVYYSALDFQFPLKKYIMPNPEDSENSVSIRKYYPVITQELEWLLLSIVDANSGTIVYNNNIQLVK